MIMQLETINRTLFQLINAPENFSGSPLLAAILVSKYSVLVLAALFIIAWARSQSRDQAYLAFTAVAALLALGINYLVGVVFPHPRPFMIGLGHTFLHHAAESSFPSDHATLMWTFAFGLLLWRPLRAWGWYAAVLAALTSWVRVFLGLHFPFDILGSLLVAACVIGVLFPLRPRIENSVRAVFARLHIARTGLSRDKNGGSSQ